MTTQAPVLFRPHAYTVLIVDDTPANLMVLADYLHDTGFRVLTARNGESGIMRAIHGRPDIVLLDVLMPGIDGFETCQRLKADPQTADIPIIFMTALNDVEHKIKGYAAGGIDYVTKPFQQEEIFLRLKTHLLNRDFTQRLEGMVAERTEKLQKSLDRQQELTEELRQALEVETELNWLRARIIEAVSHEFRTPMTVIAQSAWLLDTAYARMSTDKRMQQFQRIQESVTFVDRLITDIDFVSNLKEWKQRILPGAWAYSELAEDLIAYLSEIPKFSDRVALTITQSEATVSIDMQVFQRIIKELLSNALKFSEADKMVYLSMEIANDELIVEVCDNGIGVPDEDQDKIFDIFYRGHNVDARRGLGLGLHIATELTQMLNGDLVLSRSEIDKGSCFSLRIPDIVQVQESDPATQDHSSALSTACQA